MARQARNLIADPARIPVAGHAAWGTARSVVTQLSATDKARSPVWTVRSLRRAFETLRVPLDDAKRAAKVLGGTVNTAFVTAAAAAAGDYHRELGCPVDELRASMAISTRSESSGSNAFTLARMLVPTAKMPIDERFAAIAAATAGASATSRAASMETLASLTASMPTSLLTRLARQQGETVDFATSNVRGSPIALYLAGAKVLQTYPIGPLGGVAFNLTVLSYDGSLDMGLNIDAAAVSEPALLARCLRAAFAELIAATA
jgi:diacylglycerol O-acyltransferase / wax synthase